MAAMKPRTGDGPLEIKENEMSSTLLIPVEGGGRLSIELSHAEIKTLRKALG